jgi:hypothetical protein
MAPRESSKPSALSEEYVVDSSSDDEVLARSGPTEEDDEKHVPEPPSKRGEGVRANGRPKRPTASPSRESSSSSQSTLNSSADREGEDEDEPEVADRLSDIEKQGSSESPSEEELPRTKSNISYGIIVGSKAGCTNSHRPAIKRAITPRQYVPPTDFLKSRATVSDSASPATQFLTNDLGGKEVWHIIAPANVSMESIRPFAIRTAMRGEPILNSEGKGYCFKDGPSANKCTLIPNDTEDAYVPCKAAVSRTFHLQEIMNPPTKDIGSEANRSKQMYFEFQPHDDYPVRRKRKQPEGLHMRYKPFGTAYASREQSEAGKPNIFIPDEIPSPRADHQKGRKKKSREKWRSSAAEADPDVMELDPSQTLSVVNQGSPTSKEPSRMTSSGKKVVEARSAIHEKTKKKSKKNKHREAEST